MLDNNDMAAIDAFKSYFRGAQFDAERITPAMYSTLIYGLTGIYIDENNPMISYIKPIMEKTVDDTVEEFLDHVDHPDKCISNVYAQVTLDNVKKMDLAWLSEIARDSDILDGLRRAADKIAQYRECREL